MLAQDEQFKDKIDTEIVMMSSEKGKASTDKYKWGDPRHGLVVLDPEGKVLAQINGHSYGMKKEQALAKLKETVGPLVN